jgi:Protein of unknown function (DUF2630)
VPSGVGGAPAVATIQARLDPGEVKGLFVPGPAERHGRVRPLAATNVGGMDDKEILSHIDDLVATEHDLRAKLASGQLSGAEERERLRSAEEALDQCWDLLRQRRARREFGENTEEAQARPAGEVEGYLQ